MMGNALYYGDNLDVLRAHIRDESVYLDPPFNSNANYNVLFKAPGGEPTKPMISEAASAGIFETDYGRFPRLQIVTIHDLFEGRKPLIPFGHAEGFKKAVKEKAVERQHKLL